MVGHHLMKHVFCINLYVRKVSGAAENAIYMAIIKVRRFWVLTCTQDP